MANINAPRGFVPLRKKDGTACVASNEYSIASDYTTKIFRGEVVELTGTGTNIAQAAAANADNIGVFWGVEYKDAEGRYHFKPYWDAPTGATDIKATVYDDPNIIFLAQCDTLAEGDVGALADFAVGTGDIKYGCARSYVDVGSGTGTSGKSMRIRRLYADPENAYGAYAKVECEFAEHALIAGGGVGF